MAVEEYKNILENFNKGKTFLFTPFILAYLSIPCLFFMMNTYSLKWILNCTEKVSDDL